MTTTTQRPRRISLTIDTLVLRGMPGVAKADFVRALRGELERLLSASSDRGAFGSSRVLPGTSGSLPVRSHASAQHLGEQTAAHIARGVRP